jgi:cyanate lyase
MTLDPIRRRLLDRAAERDRSLQSLSAQLGRNPAYLHQFVHRRSPRRLPEDDRRRLAMMLEIDERQLGARDPWHPKKEVPLNRDGGGHLVAVRWLNLADLPQLTRTGTREG